MGDLCSYITVFSQEKTKKVIGGVVQVVIKALFLLEMNPTISSGAVRGRQRREPRCLPDLDERGKLFESKKDIRRWELRGPKPNGAEGQAQGQCSISILLFFLSSRRIVLASHCQHSEAFKARFSDRTA